PAILDVPRRLAPRGGEGASRLDAFYMRANGLRVDPSLQLMRGGGLQDDVGAEAGTLLSVVHRPDATGVMFVVRRRQHEPLRAGEQPGARNRPPRQRAETATR